MEKHSVGRGIDTQQCSDFSKRASIVELVYSAQNDWKKAIQVSK